MKLYSKILLFLAFSATNTSIFAQEAVFQTFKDTRVINAQTVEVLPWGKMDFRIGHRFGDIAGDAGGWQTFFGLEQATDVNFGFEYGLRQNLTLGLFRAKGAGPTRSNMVGSAKYKLMSQGENSMPITATLLGVSSISTMRKSSDSSSISSFPKFTNRISYSVQLLLARKFGNRFSLQLMPGYTYRNLVQYDDQNGFFTMGAAAKIQLNIAIDQQNVWRPDAYSINRYRLGNRNWRTRVPTQFYERKRHPRNGLYSLYQFKMESRPIPFRVYSGA
jgi:hypothetical protein